MSSTYENTVFDFDLNYLRQTTNNTSSHNKFEKQKRSIAIVKKKIIATDSLIGKYYSKKHELEETEKNLMTVKDECKQICIDYTNVMETCSRLETEIQLIGSSKKQLEEKCFNSENQCQAIQSHANQLQALVNEHDTVVESLKVENNLEKAAARNNEKKAASLQKENGDLLKHICLFRDIILGKRKLNSKHKAILQQYAKTSVEKDSDGSSSEDDSSDIGDDIFEDVLSPYNNHDSPQNNASEVKNRVTSGKDLIPMELENDCTNEIVSVDTGRGSSLAFSDNDKCFHSPDYYTDDSPLSRETIEHKVKPKQVNIATSPITLRSTVEVGTSPINVLQEDILCQIVIEEESSCDSSKTVFSPHEQKHTYNKPSSPITLHLNKSIFTNPTSASKELALSSIEVGNVKATRTKKTIQEKECLDINNSNNFLDENSNDCEIEMILNTMRLNHNLVTPIPATPAITSRGVGPVVASSQCKQTEHPKSSVCQEAVIAREENKKLHASIADLAKEIVSIKSLLKNQLLFSNQMCAHKELDSVISDDLLNKRETIRSHSKLESADDNLIMRENEDNRTDDVCSPILEDPIIIPHQDLQSLQPDTDPSQVEIDTNLQSYEDSDNEVSEIPLVESISPNNIVSESNPICVLHRLEFEDSMPLPPIGNNSITPKQAVASLDNENASHRNHNEQENIPTTKDTQDKRIKNKKLTRLEKLKKKLVPKFKIRSDKKQPVKKLRMKPKQLISPKRKIITGSDSASLNDKDVYEKAVKVMAELKAKNSNGIPKCSDDLNVNSKDHNVRTASEDMNKSISANSFIPKSPVKTRSRKKCVEQLEENYKKSKEIELEPNQNLDILDNALKKNDEDLPAIIPRTTRKRTRLSFSEKPEIESKRMLRSSTIRQSTNDDNTNKSPTTVISEHDIKSKTSEAIETNRSDDQTATIPVLDVSKNRSPSSRDYSNAISYDDLGMFSDGQAPETQELRTYSPTKRNTKKKIIHPKESILSVMVEKYALKSIKTSPKKISDTTTNSICEKIEKSIAQIIELPANDTKNAMNILVEDLQEINYKHFLSGLMKYLNKPERKVELFGKVLVPPAPPMAKSEQVLLYIITQLRNFWPSVDIADEVLCNIEYTLFKLNHTPDFDVIESMSHLYAVLCRYFKTKSRLRLFILDAMYCIQFKSVPLIKQCLDVWMHIIPLAHMGIAKSPLVTCLVYLLHFYKCEDRFNRVQDIRNILHRKYFYRITEWNETKILELIKNSIKDLKDTPIEKKMLRLAVIIIAKRHGARWCHNKIIKHVLQPMIENNNVPDKVKAFCVSLIGPLMKPYPVDMKVQCEIVINQLVDILNKNPSGRMEEAVITSLVCMSRHSQHSVHNVLLSRKFYELSPELEKVLRDFVREKSLKIWKNIFTKARL